MQGLHANFGTRSSALHGLIYTSKILLKGCNMNTGTGLTPVMLRAEVGRALAAMGDDFQADVKKQQNPPAARVDGRLVMVRIEFKYTLTQLGLSSWPITVARVAKSFDQRQACQGCHHVVGKSPGNLFFNHP